MNPWKVLSIDFTSDLREIKRAYARQLKLHKPDVDPEGYQRVRDAFEAAKRIAASGKPKQTRQRAVEPEVTISEEAIPASEAALDALSYNRAAAIEFVVEPEPDPAADESSADAGIRETIYVSEQQAPEAESVEPEEGHSNDAVADLIGSIHRTLLEDGEVAGWQAFLDSLQADALMPIDMSRQFELQVMDYLNWWIEQRHEADAPIPAGMIRQVIKHYAWNKKSSPNLGQFLYLQHFIDTELNNSGEDYLRKVADGTVKIYTESVDAARILLGRYRPIKFRLWALNSSRTRAIFQLLTNVRNLHDGSLLFELDTPTIRWWVDAQSRYLLSGGMVVAGLIFGVIALFAMLETGPGIYVSTNVPLATLVSFVLLLVNVAVFTYITFKLCYFGSLLRGSVQLHFASLSVFAREAAIGLTALAIFLLIEVIPAEFDQLKGIVLVVFVLAIIGMYQKRTFTLLMSVFALLMCCDLANGRLAHQQLTPALVVFPILAINALVFTAYLKWVKSRRGDYPEVLDTVPATLLNAMVVLLSGAWGAVMINKITEL